MKHSASSSLLMRDLSTPGPTVGPSDKGERIFELFRDDPELMLVAVVDEAGAPIGLVERQAFFAKVSGQFGHALFAGRPVALLMDDRPVIVDAAVSSTDFTSMTITAQSSDVLRGYIVVAGGRYLGTGTALDLINASHSNAVASAANLHETAEELRKANRKILRDKLFMDTIVENIPSALVVRSVRDDRLVLINRAAELMTGRERSELVEHTADDAFSETEIGHALVHPEGARREGVSESLLRNRAGDMRAVATRYVTIADERGDARWELCVADDVTERRQARQQVERLAHYDPLTGLANRALFGARLDGVCVAGHEAILLCIDLDYFKTVNDLYGHAAGDALLRLVADRLRACSRPDDLIARLGGDEFAIIWPNVPEKEELAHRAGEIVETISRPYVIDGQHVAIGASIGSASYPADAGSSDLLRQHADIALYKAKALGRNCFHSFDAGLSYEMRNKARLGDELRAAIGSSQICTMPDNQIAACEALVRWNHPVRGMIPPDQFIGLAEENGLIHELGEWVLRAACREAVCWPPHVKVAVNVSPVQFRNSRFMAIVQSALMEAGLVPHRLEVEITENIFVQNSAVNRDILRQLADMGCSVVLDDFGTGYSALSYLRLFSFQKIKIDRSFVKELPEKSASGIIQAIVSLAQSMDIPTTAEGVETQEQWARLHAMGCSEAQGFLLGRPEPVAAIRERLGVRDVVMS
ncbi:putative bifunctional diguanylate cyclase/phosphodiesterase [Gluconacetobacter diazotrophicus]|nr:EAL domain-containing protein [Gluconacetobacter diazotrophicus]